MTMDISALCRHFINALLSTVRLGSRPLLVFLGMASTRLSLKRLAQQLLVICPPINRGNWKSTKNLASIVKSPINSVSSIAMFDYRRKCLHLRSFFSTLAEVYLRSHSAHCSSPASSFVDTTTELKSAKKGPQHLCGVQMDGL